MAPTRVCGVARPANTALIHSSGVRGSGSVSTDPDLAGGTVQLVDEGLHRALASILPLAERHVVGAADELQEELRAVGRAFITDSGQRGPEPSGQGHLGESARLVGAPGARRADEHDRTDEDGVEYGKMPSADQGPPCSPLFCTSGGKKRS